MNMTTDVLKMWLSRLDNIELNNLLVLVVEEKNNRQLREDFDLSEDGYVPSGLGIGGGDYVEFKLCLDCGRIQGEFPRPVSDIERDISDEEITDFFNNFFTENEPIHFPYDSAQLACTLESAEDLCHRFGIWFESFMTSNNNYEPGNKTPSVKHFIEMYRRNRTRIEE